MNEPAMQVVSLSLTERGRSLAQRLPYEHVHGTVAGTVRSRWRHVDGFVLMVAVGAAVRIVAPLLGDKHRDPVVVCVDESGAFVVPVCGGHGGANALAREVAALLGAQAVLTTATDATGAPALDDLVGFVAEGDVAGVTKAMLEGRAPVLESRLPAWPLPPLGAGAGPHKVVVSDRLEDMAEGTVVLHPPSLVLGVGCARDARAEEVRTLVDEVLGRHELAWASVAELATVERRAGHPALLALGLPVRTFSAQQLALQSVPNPSTVVADAVGTPSVAEAAALACAGSNGVLVVPKQRSAAVTVAVARRAQPRGRLALVGLGPGGAAQRTAQAAISVRNAEVVVGYGPYVDQASDLLRPSQRIERSPIGHEEDRARLALVLAAEGRRVALVCSGDAGVYAMAALALDLAPELAPDAEIEVVPGVTAALAAAALLGAPLGHDHAMVSLSDLLTPWDAIERRLAAVAASDLVVALYNPRSKDRSWQLGRAIDILRQWRAGSTPVGVVTDAYRPGQQVVCTTLEDLDVATVGMTTCVVVGASATCWRQGRMVTPRGYRSCP